MVHFFLERLRHYIRRGMSHFPLTKKREEALRAEMESRGCTLRTEMSHEMSQAIDRMTKELQQRDLAMETRGCTLRTEMSHEMSQAIDRMTKELQLRDLAQTEMLSQVIANSVAMLRDEMSNLNKNSISSLLMAVEDRIATIGMDIITSLMKTRELASHRQIERPGCQSPMGKKSPVKAEPFQTYLEKFKQLYPHLYDVWESVNFGVNIEEFRERPEAGCGVATRETARLFGGFASLHLCGRVLDVGCGPYAVPYYLKNYPVDLISGIDPLEPFEPHPFEFVRGFAEFLPWGDNTFDVVIAATSLDHVMSLELALSEIQRVLKPGGIFLVWEWFGDDCRAYNPVDQVPQLVDKYHLFNFDEKWFEEIIQKYFTVGEKIRLYGEFNHYHYYALKVKKRES